ncbi:MAG: hypothetical protein D6785_03915 [Planctomycetota bacterium]|nr:MAG: hypothetical protein D6785_03915 [Planctomycetota bacterium]
MKRLFILFPFILMLSFQSFATSLYGNERTVIKLSVKETIDGKKSPYHISQYILLQFFYLHGFDVISVQKTLYDKKMNKTLKKNGEKDFATWQKELKKKKPLFIIEGKAKATLYNTSTFYESTVAFIYNINIELKLKNASGKVLATFKDSLKYGASNRGRHPKLRAAKGGLKNLAFAFCGPLYKNPHLNPLFQCDRSKLEARLKAIEKHINYLKEKNRQMEKKNSKENPKKNPPKKETTPPKKDDNSGGGPF